MTEKVLIDNATDNKAGQLTTLSTAIVANEGVHDLAGGDFEITANGTNRTLTISAGEAFVENDGYVSGTMDVKYWPVADSDGGTIDISANTSGNPRIDVVCIKVDDAQAGVEGADAFSYVAIEGTPAGSPSAPAIPDDHLPLYNVEVANGATSLSSGDLTDQRQQAGLSLATKSSWEQLPFSFSYGSADDPTYEMTVSGLNVTDYIEAGDKVKIIQGSTELFFICTKTAFSTNTTITLYGGTDYDLANATIDYVFISKMKNPKGFPIDYRKWTESSTLTTDNTQVSVSAISITWYNLGGNLTIPIGQWDVSYKVYGDFTRSGGSGATVFATLSTTTTTETDSDLTSALGIGGSGMTTWTPGGTIRGSKIIEIASKDIYYLNLGASTAGTNLRNLGAVYHPSVIDAVCAYL